MSNNTDEITKILFEMSLHPTFFSSVPEEAHGMFMAFAWMKLHLTTGESLEKCSFLVNDILRSTMTRCLKFTVESPMLCDETILPSRKVSYEAFVKNSNVFLALLEKKMHD